MYHATILSKLVSWKKVKINIKSAFMSFLTVFKDSNSDYNTCAHLKRDCGIVGKMEITEKGDT